MPSSPGSRLGHHAHPRRNGDRRDGAFQFAIDAFFHQTTRIGHIVFERIKDKLRRGTIPTDNKDPFSSYFLTIKSGHRSILNHGLVLVLTGDSSLLRKPLNRVFSLPDEYGKSATHGFTEVRLLFTR